MINLSAKWPKLDRQLSFLHLYNEAAPTPLQSCAESIQNMIEMRIYPANV